MSLSAEDLDFLRSQKIFVDLPSGKVVTLIDIYMAGVKHYLNDTSNCPSELSLVDELGLF